MATGNIHSGTIDGKLNGVMPTQTPTGWRLVSQSTFVAMLSSSWPMIRLGMPQANSTISMPRCTLARASAAVLPCSRVTRAASSSKCLTISSRKRNMTLARSTTGVSAHAGRAAAAACTAASISSALHSGTLAMTLPREGLKTSPQRLALDDFHWPPISSLTSGIWVVGFFASAVAMVVCG